MIAQVTGLKAGKFARFVNDMHIYDRHFEQAYDILSRIPSEKQPKLIINPEIKDFYDFKPEDINIVDYEPVYPQLKFDLGI
jgi:thymidylate synthase